MFRGALPLDRIGLPLLAALLGLAGALATTLYLHRAATDTFERALEERLLSVGGTAALLFVNEPPTPVRLARLARVGGLDAAYLLDGDLRVVTSAAGDLGGRADLLRIDHDRFLRALGGEESVGHVFSLDDVDIISGYFPLASTATPSHTLVLSLEAGQSFVSGRSSLIRARNAALGFSFMVALALAILALRWVTAERARRLAAEAATRGEVTAAMAAMAAHEVRNPLGVIRGTIELMRERMGPGLGARDREALADVLGEVERLRKLTEDLLDLSRDRPLAMEAVGLRAIIEEAAAALESAYSAIRVRQAVPEDLVIAGDPGRLRQVFANLLSNAAEAQRTGEVEVSLVAGEDRARVCVRDRGPGIDEALRARLFEPFVTGRAGGTGLGLTIARRLVEQHGGTLRLLESGRGGSTFEVNLPLSVGGRRWDDAGEGR